MSGLRRRWNEIQKTSWVFVLMVLACPVFSQEKIKVRIENDAVLIPVSVNGQSLNFLFDTGSDGSAIDGAVAQKLGLTRVGDAELLKNYSSEESPVVTAHSLIMGGRAFIDKRFPTAHLEVVSAALGMPVDGVIGTEILLTSPFLLNYSKQELTFGPLSSLGKLGKDVNLVRSGDDFFVPLRIHSVPVNLLLDSGSNSTNLSWATWQRLSQVWQPNSVVDGVVRAGFRAPPAFFVCLPNLSVGENTLTDQVVRVQRQVNDGAFADANFGGILGSEFLRQFVVTFDLANNRIFLKRDPLFKPDLYRYTTVGLQFARQSDNTYAVMGIWKNSPAEEAGIKPGDRVVAVNGTPTESLSAAQISSQLHGEEGTGVRLIMKRNSVVSAVTLHTRQMLCSPHNVQDQLRASQK